MTGTLDPGSGTNSGKESAAYSEYVASEASLLEQIRAKEEEQNARIEAERLQYISDIGQAKSEAEKRVTSLLSAGQAEADSLWKEAIDRIDGECEKIREEGEQQVRLDRERKDERHARVVERVIVEIVKGHQV